MMKSDVNYALSVKEHVGLPQSHYKFPLGSIFLIFTGTSQRKSFNTARKNA